MKIDELIRQSTAARVRGVKSSAIAQLIERGRLKVFYVDGVPHVLRSEVLNFTPEKPGPKPRKKARKRAKL